MSRRVWVIQWRTPRGTWRFYEARSVEWEAEQERDKRKRITDRVDGVTEWRVVPYVPAKEDE